MYNQLVQVARTCPDRVRGFALQATFEVAIKVCTHGEEVPYLLEGTTRASRATSIVADEGHAKLGGRHQDSIIAGVRTHDLLARSGVLAARNHRNQVRLRVT